MAEGSYQPLYSAVPVANPNGEGAVYANATPVAVATPSPYTAPQHNMYQPPAGQPYYPPPGQPYQANFPTQPVAQPYGTVAVPLAYAQPVAGVAIAGQPGHLARTGAWSDGFCDCLNHCESLLVACCVAPARWAQTVSRARLMGFGQALLLYGIPWLLVIIMYSVDVNYSNTYVYDPYDPYNYQKRRGGVLAWAIAIAAICNMFTIFLGCTYRQKLRAQYGIQGSACEDCLMHTFCPLCAITQEARHVDRDTGYLRV